MIGAIVSAVVDDLKSTVFSLIKEEVKLVTGVDHEVEELARRFRSILAVLDEAEKQQLNNACVKNWLSDLKPVADDMDDLLDRWKARNQISQLQRQHHSSDPIALKYKVLYFVRNFFTMPDVGLRHDVGGRIKEIYERLDGIAADKVRYQLDLTNESDKLIVRPTTPFVDPQTVKGRDKEKGEIRSKILEAKSNPHIVSLVGLGGIGKTTLAKLIYNDGEIQSHFEKIIWVCVSKPFDETRVAKAILESLDKYSSSRDLKEFCNVVTEIREQLNQKRFLLILDNVWNEIRGKWEELKQSLTRGLLGSTILVTTRDTSVAAVMRCNPKSIHEVELLNPEECWSIISQVSEVTLVQGDGQRLENIGRGIAEKCKGLPLVANTIGGLLRSKNSEEAWSRVLEKKEWEGGDVLDLLKLSYDDLPPHLKQCFQYCAIFPKDYEIEKERLIRMWMAQGYLRGKEENEDLEIVGQDYFNNLVARSLILKACYSGFKLHDMVSDLARTIAKDECLMIEVSNGTEFDENSLRSSANARHLTLVIEKDASFPNIYGLNKLRSLNIQFLGDESSLAVDAVKHIFDQLTHLRTLDLSNCGIKEVPSSINKLIQLRWFDLSGNRDLEKLPETLCECYNLQTLDLIDCEKLVELPQGIGKLINLMHLDILRCGKITYFPKGIGNLSRLKELDCFCVYVYENGASSIVEMEKLNNIRGCLTIRGLGNVRKVEEAREAQLMKKKNVTYLGLIFDGDHVQEDEEILEALEPPSGLETLNIREYEGKTLFPSWVTKLNLLTEIEITNCGKCEELPPLGKLSSLEVLYMDKVRVKRVGVEFLGIEKEKEAGTSFLSFPKLKILEFRKFLEWEEWDDIDGRLMESFNNSITVMPCLWSLRISDCPKLKTLPYRLLSPTITAQLQVLEIRDCPALQQIQYDKLEHIPDFYDFGSPQAEQDKLKHLHYRFWMLPQAEQAMSEEDEEEEEAAEEEEEWDLRQKKRQKLCT